MGAYRCQAGWPPWGNPMAASTMSSRKSWADSSVLSEVALGIPFRPILGCMSPRRVKVIPPQPSGGAQLQCAPTFFPSLLRRISPSAGAPHPLLMEGRPGKPVGRRGETSAANADLQLPSSQPSAPPSVCPGTSLQAEPSLGLHPGTPCAHTSPLVSPTCGPAVE